MQLEYASDDFKEWFGRSLFVDADGNPARMFHGTGQEVTWFDRMKSTEFRSESMDTVGSWFSDNPGPEGAAQYARGSNPVIYPVLLAIARPKCYDSFNDFLADMHDAQGRTLHEQKVKGLGSPEALREKLKAQGYDGIAFGRTENAKLMEKMGALRAQIAIEKRQSRGSFASAEALERLHRDAASVEAELSYFGHCTEFDGQTVVVAFEPEQIRSVFAPCQPFSAPDIEIPHTRRRQLP